MNIQKIYALIYALLMIIGISGIYIGMKKKNKKLTYQFAIATIIVACIRAIYFIFFIVL